MATAELITIPISHYCEKARWALDRAGVEYRERPHLQILHWAAVRRAGGGKTAPVLVAADGSVHPDSAEIVAFADARGPADLRLIPEDDGEAAEVLALQEDYDTRLGPHGRRWMYNGLHGRGDLALEYGCAGVPAWQRRALPFFYPVAARVIDRVLDVTPETAAESERVVDAVFDETGERLADGRPYLCGERFSAADLTFAALAASVLMPPEYGVPLPQPHNLPQPMAARVEELRTRPAGRFALSMYREERRVVSG